ncbi:uncharacterized protein LOC131238717 [Magnolia sinica]|uniref:uncharacterized protein LOC131238717 n=1 Tax=Magnolia sinica TaxID=86752 RepID=UPI0026596168|nr:uncharacterized protein LOC131238717 [Magnolia sinica]
MGEEDTKKNKNSDHHVWQVLGWISSKVNGVTRHHLEGAAAATAVISACLFVFVSRNKSKECKENVGDTNGTFRGSQSLRALHSGRVAMQRNLDAQHASIDLEALDETEKKFKELVKKEHPDLVELQSLVAKLEMSEKEGNGVKKLSKALKKAEKEGHYHDAYELDMLVVEMLIYKGDYEEALKRKCLKHQEISDARRPLYKTVIQIILGCEKDAKECWKEFQQIRSRFQWPDRFHDGLDYSVVNDFDKFKETVNFLKKEIEDGYKKPK